MSRQKKDGELFSFYLDKQVGNELRKYADENGQTLTKAVEIILAKELLKKHNTQTISNNNDSNRSN